MTSPVSHSKPPSVVIALDVMGGDYGAASVIPGAERILSDSPHVHFLLFGDETVIQSALSKAPLLKKASTIHHTDKFVKSDEKPSLALRNSKGSSMRLAIEAVQKGEAQAIVSAGNTGALMAMAKLVLKALPGIHRPAIASILPAKNRGETVMLDLGANVLVDAETLTQFAVLGAVFAKVHKNIAVPSVGLLNIGTEKNKGPEHVRGAAAILANVEIPGRYHGFVEGTDINKGTVDVVVSDGYAGNIALKTAEGVGSFVGAAFKDALKGDPLSMIGGLIAYLGLKRFKNHVDPRLYNGGVFLGLNGLCVKSHGGADDVGFARAISLAVELAKHDYIQKVSDEIAHLMSQDSFLSQGV